MSCSNCRYFVSEGRGYQKVSEEGCFSDEHEFYLESVRNQTHDKEGYRSYEMWCTRYPEWKGLISSEFFCGEYDKASPYFSENIHIEEVSDRYRMNRLRKNIKELRERADKYERLAKERFQKLKCKRRAEAKKHP